jgi:hypothetical protein
MRPLGSPVSVTQGASSGPRRTAACRGGGDGDVTDHAAPRRRPRGLARVVGYLEHAGIRLHPGTGCVRVVLEDRRSEHHYNVVRGELLGERPPGRRKVALKEGAVLRKRHVRGERLVPHRCVELLGQGHDLVPRTAAGSAVSGHDGRPPALPQRVRHTLEGFGVGGRSLRDLACLEGWGLGLPVVHRYGDEDGTLRFLRGCMVGAGDSGGDVLSAGGLVAPLDVGLRKLDQSLVQQGFEG